MVNGVEKAEYSIAAVSKLTGVSCHALRVWERRYGYPRPHRSGSNQRRYSADQVRVLRRVAELARSGRPIGELISDFRAGRLEVAAPAGPGASELPAEVAGVVEALLAGDLDTADVLLASLAAELPPAALATRVLEPAIVEVGERWFRGAAAVYQEHLASCALLRAVGRCLDEARRANVRPARRAIVASVQGERHEGGVMLLSLMLELSGWRVLTLGVDLPVAELRGAIETWRPDAVGVSFVLSRSINKRFGELGAIRGVPVFVGGRSLMNHKTLARRHGLIPLTGPISSALPAWIIEFERLSANRSAGKAPRA
jgi:MerR family transcriptional regulator, light-induced transcriptional regulator